MSKPSQKLLKAELKRLGSKKVFPRSKGVGRVALTPYQVKKIKSTLKREKIALEDSRKKLAYADEPITILDPTDPDTWIAGGYRWDFSNPPRILANANPIRIHTLYTNTDAQYYSANFFGGIIHAVFVPVISLAEYLEELQEMDNQFYDQITLREGDRDLYGGGGLTNKFDSPEELLLWLNQYKRHGSLVNADNAFQYIQVCFIQYEFNL